ncbi:MAG: DPP IV N-terminal domain-containing protein [Verrucomicrobiia bacterium]
MRNQRVFIFIVQLALSAAIYAQGRLEDYQRSANLRELTSNKVYRDQVKPNWLQDNLHFWYKVKTGQDTYEFILVNAKQGTRNKAFNHEKFAQVLRKNGIKDAVADKLPITNLRFDIDKKIVEFNCAGKPWRLDIENYELLPTIKEMAVYGNPSPCKPLDRVPSATRRTGNEVFLTFINNTTNTIQIDWLNTEGQRQNYAKIQPSGKHRQHTFAGHVWIAVNEGEKIIAAFEAPDEDCECIIDDKNPPRSESLQQRGETRRPRRGNVSPNGNWRAFVKDFNLYIADEKSKKDFQLTSDGVKDDFYTDEIYWSPDSKKLTAIRLKKGDERKVYLIESSPKDQLQPKLHSIDYLKPGDKIDVKSPYLIDVEKKSVLRIDNSLFPEPWSLTGFRWWKNSSAFVFLYNQRGHQILRLLEVNANTGGVRTIIEETSPTFIDYNGKFYMNILEDSGEIIWMSERDGWNHLYLYNIEKGSVKNQITKGEWVVRSVDYVDTTSRTIWFQAGGIYPEQDPYYIHYCKVNFDGNGLVKLTDGDGTHTVEFSPDRQYLIDTYSRVDLPPIIELRSAVDGRKICDLEKADWSALLDVGWIPPERFVAKGRDGVTDIYGIIIKPTNFDPLKKYPVIEHIYAGPQGAFVPKRFQSYYDMQSLAELGFILVQIDGMGTSYRSKYFHNVCYKNLADAGFPDRILWIKAAAKERPYMDIRRVGIYGGSAGGQNAMRALIDHNDFYKVAAADCGCHDNRMDKIWWNELWMGYPVGPHYAENSNVTQAHKLKGKLLLTVGELDRNVDPSSTMQVVNALIKADKDFDLLIIPGAGHGAGETTYGKRKRSDFFVRHLLGVEPRS